MAYSTAPIIKLETFTTTSYTADDGTFDVDWTTCGTNGTAAESCDEIKQGTLCARIAVEVGERHTPGTRTICSQWRHVHNDEQLLMRVARVRALARSEGTGEDNGQHHLA